MEKVRPKKSVYFLAVALLPLLFFLQQPNISEPIRFASQTALRPFLVVSHSVVSFVEGTHSSFVKMINSFQNQAAYEARIATLESQLIRYHELEKENERLRQLLGFRKEAASQSVGARIIGRDPSPWRQTILIDKGQSAGVGKDMAVVVEKGLVGRVIETFPNTARILLLNDSDARISAIADTSRSQGVAGGQGTSELSMRYLELDSGVQVDETVLTSGVGGLYPKGIAIGKITSLGRDPSGLHLKAKVEPFVDFSKLEEVLCLETRQSKRRKT